MQLTSYLIFENRIKKVLSNIKIECNVKNAVYKLKITSRSKFLRLPSRSCFLCLLFVHFFTYKNPILYFIILFFTWNKAPKVMLICRRLASPNSAAKFICQFLLLKHSLNPNPNPVSIFNIDSKPSPPNLLLFFPSSAVAATPTNLPSPIPTHFALDVGSTSNLLTPPSPVSSLPHHLNPLTTALISTAPAFSITTPLNPVYSLYLTTIK